MMGVNVPDDMEGRVMTEIFDPPIEVGTASAGRVAAAASDQSAFSSAEQEILTRRLRDLGYLE